MNPKALIKAAEQVVRSNSPAILAGLGVSGVVGTAYLAHQAGYTSGYRQAGEDEFGSPYSDTKIQWWKKNWKRYVPPAVAGIVTAGCIIGAVKIGNRRTAAITAAYSISEKAFSEYKDKVAEKLGERKAESVRDDIAKDHVTANPPQPGVVYIGGGTTLCYEMYTGRYFLSDMETLKRAMNEINARINEMDYATLAEFHSLIKQPPTQESFNVGWSKKLMDLEITTVLVEESRPALAFGYSYMSAL